MSKKFYWLKLQYDFFNQREIKRLRKIAGGDTYTIIYLKMQLLSIKTGGVIHYDEFEESLAEQLSLELDEDKDNIEVVINFLINYGLLEEISDNEFLLTKAASNIGKEGESAERVRKYRERKKQKELEGKNEMLLCNGSVTDCNTEKRREEKEKDNREDNNNNKNNKNKNNQETKENKNNSCSSNNETELNNFKLYEMLGFGTLNSVTMADIKILEEQYTKKWVEEALKEANDQGTRTMKYVKGILKNWKVTGIKKSKDKDNSSSNNQSSYRNPKPTEVFNSQMYEELNPNEEIPDYDTVYRETCERMRRKREAEYKKKQITT